MQDICKSEAKGGSGSRVSHHSHNALENRFWKAGALCALLDQANRRMRLRKCFLSTGAAVCTVIGEGAWNRSLA
jgi:hypothetical protein